MLSTFCSRSWAMILSLTSSSPLPPKSNQDWKLGERKGERVCMHNDQRSLFLHSPFNYCLYTSQTQDNEHTGTCMCAFQRCVCVQQRSQFPATPPHLLRSSKMSGRRKFSRDHSSARLFWRGVPVSRRRLAASYDFKALGREGERERKREREREREREQESERERERESE